MSCTGEVVMGVEEGLLLLPSHLFNELFLPFPQSYKGGSFYEERKPRMWYAYGSMEKPSDRGMKPRGTGVFLPQRPPVTSSSSQEKKKKPCPIISSKSNSRQIFLPKEWAY